MSKIKVDNLEGYENVKLSPNGTGVVEVKGCLLYTSDAADEV